MRKWLSLVLVLVLAGAFVTAWWLRPQHPSLPPGGDFTLQSAQGPISLHDFAGQVVLLYFGYTSCPDVCPTNLAQLASAIRDLRPEERRRVRVLFVSVDPQRDTPKKLAGYAHFFGPDFLGITGTPAAVAKVAQAYGVSYRKVDYPGALGYLMDHSTLTYVIGPGGRLRQTLPHAAPTSDILAAVRHWLTAEGSS